METIRILVADDDHLLCTLVSDILRKENYQVVQANSAEEVRTELRRSTFDIMMLDLCFPALRDGFAVLDDIHQRFPQIVIVMISGSGHIPDAVQAITHGAADFIEKPIDPVHLKLRLQALSEQIRMHKKYRQLEKTAIGMVGDSEVIQNVYDNIIKASKYDAPVLITGETGVGKELAANAIHRLSLRATKPMVSINCASIPKELFEAELFGYEKGAFTGAVNAHAGYFEFARGSSIFLDEVTELPPGMQAKLLRVISEGEVQKLGGKVNKISTRVISATNQDLKTAVERNEFRSDLYYRLDTIHIHIPPLRERQSDIPLLVDHFVGEFCAKNKAAPKMLTPQTLIWLQNQSWPGNARELKNAVERAMIFSQGEQLDLADFTSIQDVIAAGDEISGMGSLRETLHNFEKHYITYILKANKMNVTKTAFVLGIDKSNLSKKIKAYNIKLDTV